MLIHEVKRNTKQKSKRQVGRGGKRGKTSGKGTKGQKARSGRKLRPELRDIIKKLPKLRGRGKNSNLSISPYAVVTVNLEDLEENFATGDTVSFDTLLEKGVIGKVTGTKPVVKILSDGEITKKLVVSGCLMSVKARAKLEKAGVKIE